MIPKVRAALSSRCMGFILEKPEKLVQLRVELARNRVALLERFDAIFDDLETA